MAFKDMFKDKNDINEKSVVGFLAFAVMVVFGFADVFTGLLGADLVINEFIYNSFVIITLGALGIGEAGKIFGKKSKEVDTYFFAGESKKIKNKMTGNQNKINPFSKLLELNIK